MAVQPPAQGGLGAMAPPKPQAQAPNPAQDAARISQMEQEQTNSPQDMMDQAIQKQREARDALEKQMKILRESADIRINMPFDTSLMAAAAGFLKPTKTGSFGESAGYAAEAYAADADKALLRKQQAAKQQLEFAQAEQAMGTKNLQFEHLLKLAGVNPANATTLVAPSSTTPLPQGPAGGAPTASGPASGPAPQAAPAQTYGQTGAPNEMPPISDRDITTAYSISKEHGDTIAAIAKSQREDLIVNEGNVFSRSQRRFLNVTPPNQKPQKYDYAKAGGRETTPDVYAEYRQILKTGTEKDLWDFYRREKWVAGEFPGSQASASAPAANLAQSAGAGTTGEAKPGKPSTDNPFGLPTKFESEEDKKIRERAEAIEDAATKESRTAIEKQRATTGEERASSLINRGEIAPTIRALAKDMNSLATSNPRVFDLLQRPEISDRFAKFLKEGLQVGQFGSFSIPVEILAQNKYNDITEKDLQALQMYSQASARLVTELRKQSRVPGEGATSESEGKLYATVEALPSDSSRVIRLKSELLELRTDFDEKAAQLWVNWRDDHPGKSFDNFRLHSPEFKALRSSFDKALDERRKANSELLSNKPKEETKPTVQRPAAPTATPAAGKSNERVIGGTVWERKPDGSWSNTGRKP
jgi:hypothetical protein